MAKLGKTAKTGPQLTTITALGKRKRPQPRPAPIKQETTEPEPVPKALGGSSKKRITVNTRSRVKRPLKAPNSSPSTRITISELSKSPTPKAATCQVCFEDVEPGLQLPTPVTAASDHKHDGMCVTCVRQAIEAQSTLVAFEEIMCPFPDFGVALAHADMQRFAPKEVFARYDEFLNRKALEELPDYQQCSNAACNNGGFIDLNDSFMTCASCATVTGITCKTRYHPGLTHAESLKALE